MLAYHAQTVHSYRSVRTKSHSIDWDHPPQQFKIYPETFTRIPLDKKNPDHRFFYLIGGITAQKSYPGVTYALRTNPSAGALYPTEVYVQIRDVEGFKDGIYHLSPRETSLVLLYPLSEHEGVESFLHVKKIKGFVFLFSALYYRSSWKYKDRAFRYCLHDTGHMIGTLEASCTLSAAAYHLLYGIDKKALNKLFGFGKEEFFLSAAIVGEEDESFTYKEVSMRLPYVNGTGTFEVNECVEKAYDETCELILHAQTTLPLFDLDKERFTQAIWKRRSIRDFMQKPIAKDEFLEVMEFITQPIPSDCDVGIEIYAIINRVEGMWQGVWKEGVYLQSGDFTRKAGYLCLEQALGAESGVTFFLVGHDEQNYQAMVQKAGIIGHRLYLISTYLGFGCSGIGAYYDEEVMTFLQSDGMVLYSLAIGH
ncbi:SagB family peptide dehydrogenase [Sulfurospirillum diekertiae]|uniref:SagB family peptide dehydrogenase n=1 Tax=Sulfurospirillum diekertiae TaxID=1854492 RepID=A0A6G9VTU3_9BACT|nr:SagB family peptide dehydrogenase [Sulfurospirillum diekertiae]QIR76414.1 SagB family peptide dehydrogenase [Sulfurospirillum diekertiae]QIR79043.1 SagB family peptide dehydrogenase [Sulfurospirillum diekertiae]